MDISHSTGDQVSFIDQAMLVTSGDATNAPWMNYPSHELAKVLARVHQRQPNA